MAEIIVSNEIIKRLQAAGAIPDKCRRVVIDLVAGAPARVMYEVYGQQGLDAALAAGIVVTEPTAKVEAPIEDYPSVTRE